MEIEWQYIPAALHHSSFAFTCTVPVGLTSCTNPLMWRSSGRAGRNSVCTGLATSAAWLEAG